MHLSPVEYVIKILAQGKVVKAAKIIGCDRSTLYRWRGPSGKRGCNGEIPGKMHKKIIEIARERGLDLTAEDILFGRSTCPSNEVKKIEMAAPT